MKKLFYCLFFVVSLLGATNSYAINIANRVKCDTLIMRGSYSQLKQMEAVVLEQLKEKPTKALRGYMYALLGDISVAMGDYKGGLEWYRKSEDVYSKVDFSKEDYDELYYYMQCLYNYGNLQLEMGGEYKAIMDKCKRIVSLVAKWSSVAVQHLSEEKVLAKVMYSSFQMEQSICWMDVLSRKFPKAIEAYQKNLAALKKDLHDDDMQCNLEYGQTLAQIAQMYLRSSNNEEALVYYQKALPYIEKACGSNSVPYAKLLRQIGDVYYGLSDFDQTWDHYARSAEIIGRKGFVEHPELAAAYSGMGTFFLDRGEFYKADEYLCKAHQMVERLCGKDSYMAIQMKVKTAYPHCMLGNYPKAMDIVAEALGNKTFMEYISTDSFANALILDMEILLVMGGYAEVIGLNKEIEEILESSEHISRYTLRNFHINYGRAYKRSGDYSNAIVQFSKVLSHLRAISHDNFLFLTEEQRSRLWDTENSRINSLFALNMASEEKAPQVGGMLYDVALLNKGILLQASVNLAEVISSSGDENLKKDFTDFRLHMQSSQASEGDMKRNLKEWESDIVKRAKQFGDFMQYTNITWRDVRTALGDDDVAIEFVFSDYDGTCTCSAEVISKDMSEPKHVVLFSIPQEQISMFVAEPGKFSQLALEKIWTKELLELIGGRKNIFFVPDGELYNIGVEYIPISKDRRMCDEYNMRRLSSTREIVTRRESVGSNTCALYGGLNYNTSLQDMELYAYASTIRGGKTFNFTPDRSSGHSSWGYLPGTAEEVSSIGSTLQQGNYQVSTFTGSEGVEESFKALSGQKTKIIHIATHGFYLPQKGDPLQNSGLV
ncbi:MAG: tetratricopeptide repeat protein, partial [Bacteroidales bacterium]|nr:tetratricopeptide repeat protein [Bacteroidales bacterium]